MVNVTDSTNVNMRLSSFKFLFCHCRNSSLKYFIYINKLIVQSFGEKIKYFFNKFINY